MYVFEEEREYLFSLSLSRVNRVIPGPTKFGIVITSPPSRTRSQDLFSRLIKQQNINAKNLVTRVARDSFRDESQFRH